MPAKLARFHRRFWAFFLASWAVLALVIRHHVLEIDGEVRREGLSSASVVASRNVLLSILDIETGVRGYLIAGKKEFLRPYHEGLGRLENDLVRMRSLMSRDLDEGPHAAEVLRITKEVTTEFANQVEMVEECGLEPARRRFDLFPTKPGVDMIRSHLIAVQVEEDHRLAVNMANLDRSMKTTVWMLDAFTMVLVVVLLAMLTGAIAPPVRAAETGSYFREASPHDAP